MDKTPLNIVNKLLSGDSSFCFRTTEEIDMLFQELWDNKIHIDKKLDVSVRLATHKVKLQLYYTDHLKEYLKKDSDRIVEEKISAAGFKPAMINGGKIREIKYQTEDDLVLSNKKSKKKKKREKGLSGLAGDDPISKVQRLNKQLSNNTGMTFYKYEHGLSDW